MGFLSHVAAAQQPFALSLISVRSVTGQPHPANRWLGQPSLVTTWDGISLKQVEILVCASYISLLNQPGQAGNMDVKSD